MVIGSRGCGVGPLAIGLLFFLGGGCPGDGNGGVAGSFRLARVGNEKAAVLLRDLLRPLASLLDGACGGIETPRPLDMFPNSGVPSLEEMDEVLSFRPLTPNAGEGVFGHAADRCKGEGAACGISLGDPRAG